MAVANGTRIAEREHDRGRFTGKDAVQQFWALSQAPGDEATSNTGVARLSPFSIDPVALAVATAEKAEATRIAYRRGEPAARDHVHGGEQNGVLYTKCLRQPVLDGHSYLLPLIAALAAKDCIVRSR
jgi:hypothetical protein